MVFFSIIYYQENRLGATEGSQKCGGTEKRLEVRRAEAGSRVLGEGSS